MVLICLFPSFLWLSPYHGELPLTVHTFVYHGSITQHLWYRRQAPSVLRVIVTCSSDVTISLMVSSNTNVI